MSGLHRRILFIVAGLGAGGAERVISLMSGAWVKRGWDVKILAFDSPNDPVYHAFDPAVKIVRLGLLPTVGGPAGSLLVQGRRILAIRRTLARLQPDIAISFLTKINVLTLLATAGTRHRVIVSERNNPRAQQASASWNALLARLYPRADAIVMQTRASLDCLPAKVRARAIVINNPIAMASPKLPPAEKHVLTAVGRLAYQKGFDLLIDAFATIAPKHPHWTLRIWGEGEMRPALEQQVARLGLTHRVELPGKSRNPESWVEQANVMVLSSRHEGFANVLGEAMAAGLPVVAFDCDFGPAEMISHGVDGLLVPAGDVAAMAVALSQVMADSALRERLGRAAKISSERFSPPRIIARWDALIEDVLEATISKPARSSETPASGGIH
ncbi:MAG: glycosyltransferase family 4 protein [Sphingobium sp.]|uniref:glycosyltransferase family 4 protein n=1 Tax=Sphingobium sp. TaxID=1912891 RepID=UPI0029B757C3|nr:glycosyltransferase family 4 protein [Sphingobium sp.]MDX3909608.1 glycosyltransferase family 4 protein [Sphingobium sp.]